MLSAGPCAHPFNSPPTVCLTFCCDVVCLLGPAGWTPLPTRGGILEWKGGRVADRVIVVSDGRALLLMTQQHALRGARQGQGHGGGQSRQEGGGAGAARSSWAGGMHAWVQGLQQKAQQQSSAAPQQLDGMLSRLRGIERGVRGRDAHGGARNAPARDLAPVAPALAGR